FFFFQAEDGIRDRNVTGVQTCALPIYPGAARIGVLIALGPMNLRSRAPLQHPGIQLAPLVDVLMLLLIFFLLTWSAARNENELDVKVPKASAAKEKLAPPGDVVV